MQLLPDDALFCPAGPNQEQPGNASPNACPALHYHHHHQALLQLACHPSVAADQACADRLWAAWAPSAAALLVLPCLDGRMHRPQAGPGSGPGEAPEDPPLFSKDLAECDFQDYAPNSQGSAAATAAAQLQTPAFLLTSTQDGTLHHGAAFRGFRGSGAGRRPGPGMVRATASVAFVPTVSLSVAGAEETAGQAVQQYTPARSGPSQASLAGPSQQHQQQQQQPQVVELRTRTRSQFTARDAAILGRRRRQMAVEASRQAGRAARVQLFRSYRTGKAQAPPAYLCVVC